MYNPKGLPLIFFTIAIASAAKFPKTWKACKHDEKLNDCLKDALQSVIPFLVEGVPNFGVLPIDPLHFNELSIGKGGGPVGLSLDFKDLDLFGIRDVKILSVDTNWKTMKVEVAIPKLTLKGKYKADGKVLVLPVHGDGDCELEFENFRPHLFVNIGVKNTGSKEYYNMEKMDLTFDADHMKLEFQNLFNGDKALGDQMNVFVNENWREILQELRPAISKSLSIACTEIGNRIFGKIPKDQITPK